MPDALQRIAALASTLSCAELRVLIELTARAQNGNTYASTRQLANSANLSRPNVQSALHTLEHPRGLIASDHGSATRAASYQLAFLDTAVLPGRGSKTEPPPQLEFVQGGFTAEPGVALNQSQGGFKLEPPPHPSPNNEHARERPTDFNPSSVQVLDELLQANPKKLDNALVARVRDHLCGYMRAVGRDANRHPPDQQIVAQFLAAAGSRWEELLDELFRKRQPPGKEYPWFVGVALQKFHGLKFEDVRERRAELKRIHGPSASELQAQIRTAAAAKGMR